MALPWSVNELLPHSGAMVLLNEAVDAGEGWAKAAVRIGEDDLFFDPGLGVPSWCGIEFMAQTVALCAGVCAKRSGGTISVGFLLGTRNFKAMTEYFQLGSYLRIHVREVWQDSQLAVFDCHIEDDRRLAEARLSFYRPADPVAFLAKQRS